ncbi:type II toxin-antitoxin system Phd/YefM family antitoxin [Thiomicrorhabdus aquaedulcis]|uniref:type II toxin-antitoxin system Phd/YefM family antitoxin n=1 Tax=Thiomicrorhabdus aquaedulcis TaxID=2211106 RepID=UPI000FDBC5C2|nr:type II toxin-antitoxin system prevent-host-death family antitoxin [Thiomicrorhabdus aquaedulcis]
MQTQSFTDFRNHLALVMETVTCDHQSVTITKHGKPCAVLMPIANAAGQGVPVFDAIVAWRQKYLAEEAESTVNDLDDWAAVRENELGCDANRDLGRDLGRDFSW